MIKTEAGLKQTIEQLNRMYRVVEDQRRRMGSTNPTLFQLFAEGPLDEIRKLRREIDDFLGIQPAEFPDEADQPTTAAGQR